MTDPLGDLDQLLNQLAGEPPTTPSTPSPQDPPAPPSESDAEPAYGDLGAFVNNYLVKVVERRIATGASSGLHWCPRWWAHPEAISRLYALWRTWETLRVSDPASGMSIWWRDHLDPHLTALTGEYGPFGRCRTDKHTPPKPLPAEPVPAAVLAKLPERCLPRPADD